MERILAPIEQQLANLHFIVATVCTATVSYWQKYKDSEESHALGLADQETAQAELPLLPDLASVLYCLLPRKFIPAVSAVDSPWVWGCNLQQILVRKLLNYGVHHFSFLGAFNLWLVG